MVSSTCEQARGHLLATGSVQQALLCYCTPADKSPGMNATLTALSAELKAAGFDPGKFSTPGWAIEKKHVQFIWDAAFSTFTEAQGDRADILELEPDTNPSPLIIVYTDEDCYDPDRAWFYRRAMIEQVRAALLYRFHVRHIVTRAIHARIFQPKNSERGCTS